MWAASYMVINRGISAETAAKWTSIFYLGITLGRFVSGFITVKLNDKNMVRLGQGIIIAGIVMLLLPIEVNTVAFIGLIMVGIGCAPIYPSLLHATPNHFGADVSQSIMGMQMACAYVGSTFMPPLFGLLQSAIDIKIYPLFLSVFVILMIIMLEMANKKKAAA